MYDGMHFKPVAADNADSVIAQRRPSDAEIAVLVRNARAQRDAVLAEAVADVIAKAALWFRRWREQAAAIRELDQLDDRSLNDIGISRHDISALVYGARRAGPVLRGRMLADFVEDKMLSPFRAWRLRARTRRELMALDDAALRDIGIERGQIEGIAASVADARAVGRTLPVTAALILGGFEPPQPANVNVLARRAVPDAAD
jgi:uncharacterized protein YjiS (DUF1127 family)